MVKKTTKESVITEVEAMEEEPMVLSPGDTFPATIDSIEKGTAKSFFGDKTRGEKDTVCYKAYFTINSPKSPMDGAEGNQIFSVQKGYIRSSSNVAKFRKKYGSYPRTGQEVTAEVDADEFIRIKLD